LTHVNPPRSIIACRENPGEREVVGSELAREVTSVSGIDEQGRYISKELLEGWPDRLPASANIATGMMCTDLDSAAVE